MSQTPSRLAGLSEVLAGVLIVCCWGGDGHGVGDVGHADGGEGGRVAGLRTGGDAVGLAGGGLGEQLDGKAGVAGGVAVLGIGQDGDGFAAASGARVSPASAARVWRMAVNWAGCSLRGRVTALMTVLPRHAATGRAPGAPGPPQRMCRPMRVS